MEFKSTKFVSDPRVIKLKGGQSVVGVLRGDPITFESSFKDQPAKFRFKIEIVTKENEMLVARVLEGGWKLYKQLEALQGAGWDLHKSFLRVVREGSGINDTVYSANCLPTPPDAAALAKINSVPRLDLESPATNPVESPSEVVPF